MVIKIYMDLGSQPCRTVRAYCIVNNIPHEIIQMQILKKQNQTPEFEKINPLKTIPAIEDTENGFCLAESHAIMHYLGAKYKVDNHWYPKDDYVKQAKIHEYLDFHHQRSRKCAYLVFHIMFNPLLKIGDPTFDEEYTRKLVATNLAYFQSHYLKDTFIGGEKPCIADLSAYPEITFLELLDYDYSPYPKIQKWIAEMRKIEAIVKVDEHLMAAMPEVKKMRPQ